MKCFIELCWSIVFIFNLLKDFLIKTREINFAFAESILLPCMNLFKTTLPIEQYGSYCILNVEIELPCVQTSKCHAC